MNAATFATDSIVSSPLRPSTKPTYLNSRFGASRQAAKSPLAHLEEMIESLPAVELPVTSTMRLLEVSCGLTLEQVEQLVASAPAPAASTPTAPDKKRVARCNFSNRLGEFICTLLLTGGVVASLIALS